MQLCITRMPTPESRGDKTQGVPPLQKVGGTCPPVHPWIYAHVWRRDPDDITQRLHVLKRTCVQQCNLKAVCCHLLKHTKTQVKHWLKLLVICSYRHNYYSASKGTQVTIKIKKYVLWNVYQCPMLFPFHTIIPNSRLPHMALLYWRYNGELAILGWFRVIRGQRSRCQLIAHGWCPHQIQLMSWTIIVSVTVFCTGVLTWRDLMTTLKWCFI